METQTSLFDIEPPNRPESGGLLVLSHPGRPLTKAQRTFNRLAGEIERLRSRLNQEVRRLDKALAYYGEHLYPRLQRQKALRKDIVRALVPFLQGNRLKTKRERKALRTILAGQLDAIILQEGSLFDDDLRALFERVHGVDFAQAEREGVDALCSAMEDMFGDLGIDLDLSNVRPDMSEEAFAEKAAEMAEKFRQQAEEEQRAQQPERRKTKRQIEKETRRRHAEEVRKKSIATIYKQLAKVLHPDLEPDAAFRERKVVLMQELTVAYRNNDLHTLLRMELEWIQREKGDLERLTDEKLAIYSQVLKEQVQTLEREIAELPCQPRYQPIAIPDGPFGVRLRTDGPAEARLLDEMIVSMELSLARLQTGEAIEEVRGLIQEFSAANLPATRRGDREYEYFHR